MRNKVIKRLIAFLFLPSVIFFLSIIAIAGAMKGYIQNSISALGIDDADSLDINIGSNEKGKATYVGVDDKDTAFSNDILKRASIYSEKHHPFFNGYMGYCEKWCQDIYRSSGHSYNGSCCAYTHGKNYAKKDGKIPKGAVIFSGRKPDGSYYQNGGRRSEFCTVCNNFAGHVAIYIGDGKVAGSQIPFIYSLDNWINVFGYGGWSLN